MVVMNLIFNDLLELKEHADSSNKLMLCLKIIENSELFFSSLEWMKQIS